MTRWHRRAVLAAACALLSVVGGVGPANATPLPSIILGAVPPVGWGAGHAEIKVYTYKQMDVWSVSLRVRSDATLVEGWLALGSEDSNRYYSTATWPGITAPNGLSIIDCVHGFSIMYWKPETVGYAQYKFYWETVDDDMTPRVSTTYSAVFSYAQPGP